MDDLTCQALVELVSDYLEGRLGDAERTRVEAHLAVCEPCVRYVDQMRETLRLVGTIAVDTLSPEAQSSLLAAFRDLER